MLWSLWLVHPSLHNTYCLHHQVDCPVLGKTTVFKLNSNKFSCIYSPVSGNVKLRPISLVIRMRERRSFRLKAWKTGDRNVEPSHKSHWSRRKANSSSQSATCAESVTYVASCCLFTHAFWSHFPRYSMPVMFAFLCVLPSANHRWRSREACECKVSKTDFKIISLVGLRSKVFEL